MAHCGLEPGEGEIELGTTEHGPRQGHGLGIAALGQALDRRAARIAVGELADAAGAERYSLGLVFPGPATGGDAAGLSQLLASLRDRYARRVLVSDSAGLMALSDYLALGFERLEGDGLESLYLFDPDAESRQREWNNPRNWANPENFDRYRW